MQPPVPPRDTIDHRGGFLVGAAVGAALAAATARCADAAGVRAVLVGREIVPLVPPSGRRRAAVVLADELIAELAGGGVDLHRLARRWVEWAACDGFEADPVLALALDHLREFDAPVTSLPSGSMAAVAAALPAALAAASPRGMVAGAFHVARLLDPEPNTALAAVAVVVAAATFLEGRRDFVADVIAALRANEAPERLLDAVRAVPRDPHAAPPVPGGEIPDPLAATTALLWLAHHRPHGAAALRELTLVGGVAPTIGAVAGALLGARDGVERWPPPWLAIPDAAARENVAGRLGGADQAGLG